MPGEAVKTPRKNPDARLGIGARARIAARVLVGAPVAVAGSFRNAARTRLRVGPRPPIAGQTAHRDQRTLDELIADCEDLARNNHLVRAMLSANRDVVVGHAPAVEPTSDDAAWNDRVRERFEDWAAGRADVYGQHGFWDLAGEVVTRAETAGGIIAHRVRDGDGTIRVELIDVIRLRNPNNGRDTETMRGGVELDGRGVRPVRYHIADFDATGAYLRTASTRPLPASVATLINCPRLLAAGQWRAEPGLASVVDRLEVLDRTTEAAFAAYEIAANNALVVTRDFARSGASVESELAAAVVAAGEADSTEEAIREGVWRAGTILEFDGDTNVNQIDSPHPSTPFQEAFWSEMMAIAASIDLPLEIVYYRYIRNFHASRSAIATAWRRIQARQAWLTRQFVKPVYRAWLAGEIRAGRVEAVEGWDRCGVRLATMPVLDPKVEVEATSAKLAAGLITHEAALAEHGVTDREAFMARRAAELEEERRIGLRTGQRTPSVTTTITVDKEDENDA